MSKKIFSFFLFIVAITAIQDVFIPENSPLRPLTVITQAFGVLACIYSFFNFIKQDDKYFFGFNFWLTLFIIMLTSYALFNPLQINNYSKVLYSILPFFIFYNASRLGISLEKKLQKFSIFVFIISVYDLYLGFFKRQEEYGELMNVADNISYQLLAIMVVIATLKPKKINFILFIIAFIAILFSLKRGAIVASVLLVIYYLIQNIKNNKSSLAKIKVITIISFVIFSIVFGLIKYSEILLYRFIREENTSGSGRTDNYMGIINDWLEFPFIFKITGKGFFSLGDGLTYAHSDWFQLLYDHGLIGVVLFTFVLVSLFNIRKKIKKVYYSKYYIFIGICLVIFLKSIFSGTYMTKYDAIIYGVLGGILGELFVLIKKQHNKPSIIIKKTVKNTK